MGPRPYLLWMHENLACTAALRRAGDSSCVETTLDEQYQSLRNLDHLVPIQSGLALRKVDSSNECTKHVTLSHKQGH